MIRTTCLPAIVCLLVFLAGCGEAEPVPPAPTDAEADELRIISLTPNVTEILFAMGLGDSVVGRSTYCRYPPPARELPAIGDAMTLDAEQILRLDPTHAFITTGRKERVDALKNLGMKVVPLASDTMGELMASIAKIGRATGHKRAADELIQRIRGDLDAVRDRVRGLGRPKVLFAMVSRTGSMNMTVAGRGTFVDDLLSVAGAENAYPEKANWPQVGPEQVIRWAPDVVIVYDTELDLSGPRARAVREAWAQWSSIPAVANDRVILLNDPILTIPGPRMGVAAMFLARVLHPELRADPVDELTEDDLP